MRSGLCAVVTILCCTVSFAQVISSRLFNEEKGLAQRFIFSLAQDRNGILLLGTERGLVRFNGDQFVTHNAAQGLAEDQVSCVYSDTRGRVWVGHFQKGISCLNGKNISVIDSGEAYRGRICSFAEDPSGRIWGAADGKGIFMINPLTRKATIPAHDAAGRYLAFDLQGQLIAGGDEGLCIYKVEQNGALVLKQRVAEAWGKKIDAICLASVGGRELLFAAVEEKGVYCFLNERSGYRLRGLIQTELRCNELNFSSMAFGQGDHLWLGTIGEGLRKISFSNTVFPVTVEVYDGLPDDNVKSLLVDLESNLWVGTFGRGLLQLPYSVFHFYTQANGLPQKEVTSVVKDGSGAFWLGSKSGISRFVKDGLEPARVYNGSNGFVTEKVTCLAADRTGMIWIGTYGEGIFRLDPRTAKFENISQRYRLDSKQVNTITIAHDDRILFGTTDGLYVYFEKEKRFQYYTTLDGLLHNNIQQLYTDPDNNVWFSSPGTPPYLLQHEEITAFRQIDKLKGYNVNGVCRDKEGNCWIGTDGDGLFSFDGEKFAQYSTQEGLKSPNCIGVMADERNLLWVVHKGGLSMRFPGDSIFYFFSGSENKLFDEMNPYVYKDSSGIVYLCSNYGLIEISLQDKSYIRREPKISLARMFVNGSESAVRNELALQPGTYNLSFEFNNILHAVATRPPIWYRIAGADSVWRMVSGRDIIIPQLSSGSYVLQVSAARARNILGPNDVQVRIFIDQPFWKKTWFILLSILSVPLIILVLIRLQTLSLIRLNKRLQGLVREKTKQLEEEKESVSRMNLELQSKNRDITDSIHYAKRIQMAVLPDMQLLRNQFPENFIFYLPRDIVSGDFYWFAQKGDLFIIAVVDCTGHGIPGAFMSMIGSTLLNKIVFDYELSTPANILQALDSEVTSSLHQQDASMSSHDGMDIALCVIDKSKSYMRFSGAGRPLYLVRDKEVHVFKTGNGSIGGMHKHLDHPYEEITLRFEPGDSFYMLSDGYTDQFSDTKQTKFSSKRLRMLLQQIAHLPMAEQEQILSKTFFDWKGEEFQFDDVLVIGFKT